MKKLVITILVLVLAMSIFAQGTITNGTLSFPNGTTAIKNSAYQTDQEIKHIKFPSGLKTIGSSSFRFCAYIDDDLVLPNGLESIGKYAFYNCVNVHKITVPKSVTTIGEKAFSKNATLIVKKNSYAHQWAEENGYDYQFTNSGLPVGVTKVYQDFFVKTAWNQRGDKHQFSPNKERVLCSNLAFAGILYYYNIRYHGSHKYKLKGKYISADFDKNQADLKKIPRIFISSYSDERMYDADLYLWNHCVAVERGWGGTFVSSDYNRDDLMMMFAPIKINYHQGPFYDHATRGGETRAAMEKMLKENFANKRPIYTRGESKEMSSDHGWILDGLREKNGKLQVHCNFGWNGGCDGWYYLWEPIKNDMIDYPSTYSSFREFIPLSGAELAKWKAPTIETETVTLKDGNLYIPDGTPKITRDFLKKNKIKEADVKTINIPISVKAIYAEAFRGCANLKEVTIPEDVEEIAENVFAQVETVYYNATDASKTSAYAAKHRKGSPFPINDDMAVKHFIIGKTVKVIPAEILQSNYSLKELTIPKNVETIGIRAFNGTCLEKVIIEDGVKTIEDYALSTSLMKTIVIPASVTTIGKSALNKKTIVICPTGSYAETWAKQNGNTVVNN